MSDDLVKRLREPRDLFASITITRWWKERLEAAARIEALERQVKAADALAEQVQRVKDFRYDPNIGIELNRLEEALTACRATKEGGA